MKRRLILGLLVVVAACEDQMPPAPEPMRSAAPIPEELCKQARSGLEQIRKEGVLISKDGEHMMDQQSWLEIGQRSQDQLVQALAVEQACDRKDSAAEREVVIRNEGNQVLVRRIVTMEADLGTLANE